MSRVLLISFAGYPYSPSSLMPDNGLASLAGCLIDAGHHVRILSYSTVSAVEPLFPKKLRLVFKEPKVETTDQGTESEEEEILEVTEKTKAKTSKLEKQAE